MVVNGRVAPSSLPLILEAYLFLTVEQLPKAVKLDYPKWVNRVHIIEKGFGDPKPLKLNGTQLGILDELNNWSVLLKPRQVGGTLLMQTLLLYFADKIKNANITVMSYNMDNAVYHLNTIKQIVESMPEKYGMPIDKRGSTKEVLAFSHSGSTMYAKSGGTRIATRGTKNLAVLSTETSFWMRDFDAFASYSKGIVPGGWNLMESTPNGMGNLFQETYFSARSASIQSWNVFKHIFRKWTDHPEFSMRPPERLIYTPEEKELIKTHNLTDEQLFWRRTQLDGFPNYSQKKYAEFCAEYPIDDESCWLETNDNPFTMNNFKKMITVEPMYGQFKERIYHTVDPERRYYMGVDTSLGKDGSDQMAIVVLDDEAKVCCVFADNVSYSYFCHIAIEIMKYYRASVFVEQNGGYGMGALERLKAAQRAEFIRGSRVSEWMTTGTSKELMFNKIDDFIATNRYINDVQLKEQIMKYNMSATNNKDDVLMAFGMAIECMMSNKRSRFDIVTISKEDKLVYQRQQQKTNFYR